MSYADQKRASRARLAARGGREKRKPPPSAFRTGRFVAVDGEGFSDGADIRMVIGHDERVYEARDHRYALLMDSDGEELWAPSGRLAAKQCLDFLLDIKARDENAVPVIFGGSYDVCHMLAFGLERDDILQLLRENVLSSREYVDVTLSHGGITHDYRIEYRPRKTLAVWRFEHGADKYRAHHKRDGTRQWKLAAQASVRLWDVWGFFQGSFAAAMENWIPGDPDYQFVAKMKRDRATFERSEIDTIRKYTAAELRCLVAMMERVRDAVGSLDLTIARWDGAGAIAKAMFRKNGVKDHQAETPPEVFEAARVAYSGGHIEAMAVGYHSGRVFHYDVNSAYPDKFRLLPSYAAGRWEAGTGAPPAGHTLVRVEFHFEAGRPFYPLFHRSENGSIRYPERGAGWYWFEEYDAARAFAERFGAYEFRVAGWHHFRPAVNEAPFRWIEEAYQVRRDVIMRARATGVRDDSHMMIRLGLNSCYGATAQQIGARLVDGVVQPPTFFQLEWAGCVTAGCRAQLMRAAMQKPWAIISFATDAVFSTEPLDLPCDPVKRLGEWEAHEHPGGMSIVMPGVYWLHDEDKIRHFSRGFDKEQMSDVELIHDAWRQGRRVIAVKQRRMITLGAAMMSENFWKLRGQWVDTTRDLALHGGNVKRHSVAMTRARPHKELCATTPQALPEDAGQSLASLMSAPYPIAWLDLPPEALEASRNEPDADAAAFFIASMDTSDAAFLA